MFEQGFTFKKSAWHARLMKYIWNLGPRDFDYMCPYFWLSVFNVIIAPVVLPLKFIFWNLIPIICKDAIWPFIVWNYQGIERVLSAMGDKFDAWAVENQRKWDEKREREMLEFRGRAMEFLESMPERILDIGIRLTQSKLWQEDSVNHAHPGPITWVESDDFWRYHRDVMSKKERKMWAIFGGVVKKNSKAPAKIVETIKEKAAAEYSGGSFTPFVYVPETEEERIERERKQAMWKAAADKRKAEEKAKEDEKERIKQLRLAEAEQKRLAEREKWLIRQKKRETQRLRNKQRINAILKFAKPIATAVIWIVGILAAIVGLYFVMKGLIIVWGFFTWAAEGVSSIKHTSYVKIGNIFKWIGFVIIGLGIIVGLVALLQYIGTSVKEWAERNEEEERRARLSKPVHIDPLKEAADKRRREIRRQKSDNFWEGVGNVFGAIGSIFPPTWRVIKFIGKFIGKMLKLILITPFVKLWKGLVTFVQIIKQTYDDNCPPITWKD